MSIRSARLDDQQALFDLYHALSPDHYQDDIESFKIALAHPATEVYVLEEDSKVVGTCTLSHRAVPSSGLVGYIDDNVIHPDYQQRGLGTILTGHCVSVLRQKGCRRVELTCKPSRIGGNALYENMGFVIKVTNVWVLEL